MPYGDVKKIDPIVKIFRLVALFAAVVAAEWWLDERTNDVHGEV